MTPKYNYKPSTQTEAHWLVFVVEIMCLLSKTNEVLNVLPVFDEDYKTYMLAYKKTKKVVYLSGHGNEIRMQLFSIATPYSVEKELVAEKTFDISHEGKVLLVNYLLLFLEQLNPVKRKHATTATGLM